MIRKLVLPALAAALLAGCVTDYGYRGGDRGDYYYGQPSVDYRYDSGYYAPYGYGSFGYGTYGYPYRYYGAPYGHRGYDGYYNRPYYPPYHRPHHQHPPVVHPRPDGRPPQHRDDDDRRPPWRNLDGIRRQQSSDGGGPSVQQREVVPARPVSAEPRERGSRMEQTIRRANRSAESGTVEQEP